MALKRVTMQDIADECGEIFMEERSLHFAPERRQELEQKIQDQEHFPMLAFKIDHISYLDGCKIWLKCGGWVSCRFSGTEPLVRIFSEMPRREDAARLCDQFEAYLGLQS